MAMTTEFIYRQLRILSLVNHYSILEVDGDDCYSIGGAVRSIGACQTASKWVAKRAGGMVE